MDRKPAAKETKSRKLKFRLSGTVKPNSKAESRDHTFCVSWSSDIFLEETFAEQEDGETTSEEEEETLDQKCNGKTLQQQTRYYRCLASVSGPYAAIYEVEIPDPHHHHTSDSSSISTSSGEFILKQAYFDPDVNEKYFTCVFGGRAAQLSEQETAALGKKRKLTSTVSEQDQDQAQSLQNNVVSRNGAQLLCVGGASQSIKVIDCARMKLLMTLQGHGGDVNDLQISPIDEWLLLSASGDQSCRLWNLKNGTSIAIFSGHEAHRDAVVSVSWHCFGDKFVSASVDTRVKIWDIENGEQGGKIKEAIQKSNAVKLQKNDSGTFEPETYFKPLQCQFPIFSTNHVHINTVDCVQFVGDIILSKSIDEILMWFPVYPESMEKLPETPYQVQVLRKFVIPNVEIWFYRFGTDPIHHELLAVGNQSGDIYLWQLGQEKDEPCVRLRFQKRMHMVRKTVFSPDGKILLCCSDDGSLWKWDVH